MKATCLTLALAGLAAAQEPSHPAMPVIPGMPADIMIPTHEPLELAEPLRWAFGHAAGGDEVVRTGPVGFLGVSSVPVPDELSGHLKIPRDTGLRIAVVAKDSPAEKAGLAADDILARLDDQILIHPRQFAVLVANKNEGDTVKIDYIRKGERLATTAVLGKKEGGSTIHGERAELLLHGEEGKPLRTFVRRFQIPGGSGEVKIAGSVGGNSDIDINVDQEDRGAPATPPDADVQKQLAELRAMLEALQKQIK